MQNRVFLGCEAPEMFPLWASRSSSKSPSCQFLPWICGFSISLKPPELPREAARADPKLPEAMSNASSAPSLCVRPCPLSLQGQQGGLGTALAPDLRVPPQRDSLSPPCSVVRAFVHSARSDAGCLAAAGLHYSLLSAVICYAPSPRGHGRLFSSPGFSPGASQMPSTHGTEHGESLGYLTGHIQACPRGAAVRSLPEVGLGVWCLLLSLIFIF